jgi:Plant transposon protein
MLGSLDCTHWEWKNCPVAWAGQYTGKEKKCTVALEAVATYDTWIWHTFFGTPGSCNDINILDHSNLFIWEYTGNAPQIQFLVNGNTYDQGYYLVDGTFPDFPTLIKTISVLQGQKKRYAF